MAVAAHPELLHERAGLIELEQPRLAAARFDEDVPLRVGGHAHGFAHVQAGRQLEEIRDDLKRDFRGRSLGFSRGAAPLGQHQRRAHSDAKREANGETSHGILLFLTDGMRGTIQYPHGIVT